MSQQSPMMNKLKSSSQPKKSAKRGSPLQKSDHKGFLRKVLIAVILLVVGVILFQRTPKAPVTDQTETEILQASVDKSLDSSQSKKSSNKTPQVVKPPKVEDSKKPVITLFAPKDLEYLDVKRLLTEIPPTLKQSVDTVRWKNQRLIRYFSLDTNLQQRGNRYMRRYHPKYGGGVVMQPRTGRVLALISYNNPEEKHLSSRLYGSAYFPAASIAKVITSAAVLEKNRLNTRSKISITGKNHTLYTAQLQPMLSGTKRDVSFQDAFAYSINPIFGRLGIYHSGASALFGSAQKFGFNESVPFELPIEKSRYELPADTFAIAEIASGFNQRSTLSPMLGALMSGAISNKGRMIRPTFVDSIVTLKDHETIYKRKPQLWRIATTQSSAQSIEKMMNSVARYGSARKSLSNIKDSRRFDSFSYGGKTGTVDKDSVGRVEWFVGFLKDSTDANKHLSCGLFMIHGEKWTVRSSYLAGELLRYAVIDEEKRQKEVAKAQKEATKEATKKLEEENKQKEKSENDNKSS